MITWKRLSFSQFTPDELYNLLQLRINVFVVEQTCPYPELDDKDRAKGAEHLLGYRGEELIACARLLPPGLSYPSASIGRIATKASARGDGMGHELLKQALTHMNELWPGGAIEIGAQAHLANYYQSHGFVQTSEPYLEDDILHIDMKRVGQ